jgi:adenylate kinase family enzyme
MAQKNIVEKYIEVTGKFIILISGLPGCGKQELGQSISRDFKFKLLDTYNYYKPNYDNKVKLTDPENGSEIELTNWYTDDAIDWPTLTENINKYKKDGVVIVGISLPKDKIDSDYHIHLNISKQVSMEKTREYIKLRKDKFPEDFEMLDTPFEKLKMNKLIYPYYLEITKMEKINKYITVKDQSYDEVYDIAFDLLIQFVQKYLGENIGKVTKSKNLEIKMETLEEPKYSYDDDMDMIRKYGSDDEEETDSEDTGDITDDKTDSIDTNDTTDDKTDSVDTTDTNDEDNDETD